MILKVTRIYSRPAAWVFLCPCCGATVWFWRDYLGWENAVKFAIRHPDLCPSIPAARMQGHSNPIPRDYTPPREGS